MSVEGLGYKPEDLLQAEGENMGNVKDKDLAEKMATAEDKYQSSKLRKGLYTLGETLSAAGGDFRAFTGPKPNDLMAQKAAETEIARRVNLSAAKARVSDKTAVRDESLFRGREFRDEQDKLNSQRINEQRKKISEI